VPDAPTLDPPDSLISPAEADLESEVDKVTEPAEKSDVDAESIDKT